MEDVPLIFANFGLTPEGLKLVRENVHAVMNLKTFDEKGVKAAAARARQALNILGKLTKTRRKEIQEKKNGM